MVCELLASFFGSSDVVSFRCVETRGSAVLLLRTCGSERYLHPALFGNLLILCLQVES